MLSSLSKLSKTRMQVKRSGLQGISLVKRPGLLGISLVKRQDYQEYHWLNN